MDASYNRFNYHSSPMAEPFPETDWAAIRQLQDAPEGEHQLFLEHFCQAYHPAVTSFLHKSLRLDEETAEDLAHDFILNKVLSKQIFLQAKPSGKFRSLLRTALRNHTIDFFRKKRPQSLGQIEQLERGLLPDQEEDLDLAWATAIFQNAINTFRENSSYWNLFEARVLTQPPVPYELIVESFGFATPEKASNALMTAKRQFNRIINEVLLEHSPTPMSTADVSEEISSLNRLLQRLNKVNELVEMNRSDTKDASESATRGVSVFGGEPCPLIDESEVFSAEHDLQGICLHLLRLPLATYLREDDASYNGKAPLLDAELCMTFAEFCSAPEVSFATIQLVKNCFNRKAKSLNVVSPSKINVMMTFVCIAKTMTAYPQRLAELTRMHREKAVDGIRFFAEQAWLPDEFRTLFLTASR